jgi:hypothetical protein
MFPEPLPLGSSNGFTCIVATSLTGVATMHHVFICPGCDKGEFARRGDNLSR